MQPLHGAVEQGPDDRLRGLVTGELVQVVLDNDGSIIVAHGDSPAMIMRT